MRPSLYLETSVISILAGRRPRDIIQLARYEQTLDWWENNAQKFELLISGYVLEEIARGDKLAANQRVNFVREIEVFPFDAQVEHLASLMLRYGALPKIAKLDALHVASATVFGVDYLMSWNCTHIANAVMRPIIERVCRNAGYEPSVIATPIELMEI